MKPEYITVVEKRLQWLKFIQSGELYNMLSADFYNSPSSSMDFYPKRNPSAGLNYEHILNSGDTYYMDEHFCDMVDIARKSVPLDIEFDTKWILSKVGWLYVNKPFIVPDLVGIEKLKTTDPTFNPPSITVKAIGWIKVTDNDLWFATFIEPKNDNKFIPWSYFSIREGAKLGERINLYEKRIIDGNETDAYYIINEYRDLYHEMRWIYASMYLLSQKLATKVRVNTDRSVKRRAERDKLPIIPFIEVVTLRRKEQDKQDETHGKEIAWNWQWKVDGHWRSQWYPLENKHKPKFIEAYIKGPDDKPLKPSNLKIYTAVR